MDKKFAMKMRKSPKFCCFNSLSKKTSMILLAEFHFYLKCSDFYSQNLWQWDTPKNVWRREHIMFEKVIRSHPTCPEALIIAQDQTGNLPTHLDTILKKIPHFLQNDTFCSFVFEESPRNWPHFWWYRVLIQFVYFIQRYNTILFRCNHFQ